MITEILWCETHDGIVWGGQPAACFKVERDKNLVPIEECRVVRRLLVDPDAPSITIPDANSIKVRRDWDNMAESLMAQVYLTPPGRYVLVEEA